MVKGWADHCSSDEEEEEEHNQLPAQQPVPPAKDVDLENNNHEAPPPPSKGHLPPSQERRERVYEYPSEPPYTAFVGNLAYSIGTRINDVRIDPLGSQESSSMRHAAMGDCRAILDNQYAFVT